MAINIIVNMAKVEVMGTREIGLEMPMKGRTKLIKAPLNMTKAMLRPTE